MIRTYEELVRFPTFEERLDYLMIKGKVGAETFGFDRWLNQHFYKSEEWKRLRRDIIIRDNACDLATDGYDISGKIIIHHMNPITADDILKRTSFLMNPSYLVAASFDAHQAIHYANADLLKAAPIYPIERKPHDTCPWKRM